MFELWGNYYVLAEQLEVPSIFGGDRPSYIVPQGYESDGASIPRIAWPLIGHPFMGKFMRAATVHDWLCEQSETYGQRAVADGVFVELLRRDGVKWWRRALMYLAVRAYAVCVWSWTRESNTTPLR